jgi:hypothetical protein
MSKLYVTEYAGLMPSPVGGQGQVPICGTAPTAATTSGRFIAGQTEYRGVPIGQAFKVSAITNT